jgi:hypothetical protein
VVASGLSDHLLRTEVAVTAGRWQRPAPQAAADGPAVRGALGLWLALLAGPSAATLQLSLNYALVKWACANGGEWVLTAITVASFALAIGGAALGVVHLVATGDERGGVPIWSADSRRVLAITAVGLDLLIAILLVNSLIAIAALTPCE